MQSDYTTGILQLTWTDLIFSDSICPVTELDGARIGERPHGPITTRLQAAYREEVTRRCAPSAR